MTERERLIELLNEVGGNLLKFPTENFIEAFADYLLANGVVVLPCIAMVEQFIKDGEFDKKMPLIMADMQLYILINRNGVAR